MAIFRLSFDILLLPAEFQTKPLAFQQRMKWGRGLLFEIQRQEAKRQNPNEILPFRLKFKRNSVHSNPTYTWSRDFIKI